MEFGIAIALMIAATAWAIYLEKLSPNERRSNRSVKNDE